LDIKDDETGRLVQELARLTGENETVAINTAVRERLNRVHRERRNSLAERLVAIGQDCAAHLGEPCKSAEHGNSLYDEDGLPR
jgi:antitoxin VapB